MPHTPGPWEVHQLHLVAGVVVNSVHVCKRASDMARGCRSIAQAEILGVPRLEAEANARLIAAAPELLAALTALVDLLNDDLDPDQCAAWDTAVAAIAKAEGR